MVLAREVVVLARAVVVLAREVVVLARVLFGFWFWWGGGEGYSPMLVSSVHYMR